MTSRIADASMPSGSTTWVLEAPSSRGLPHDACVESRLRPPTVREVLLLAIVALAVVLLIVALFDGLPGRFYAYGDSAAYASIANAIRRWLVAELTPYHFWGLPYAVAAISLITPLGDMGALIALSLVSSLLAVHLSHRLWGGWTAAALATLNWDWLQRSTLGGAEPFFLVLLFSCFQAVRHQRWLMASLLASYATTVRPTAIFALVAMAIVLGYGRQYRALVLVTGSAMLVGALYVVPLWIYFGDPLANFHFYQNQDWADDSPIGFPFVTLIRGLADAQVPATTLIRVAFWIVFAIGGAVALAARPSCRQYARAHPMEILFAAFYFIFLFGYNSPIWSWAEFSRYSLPVLPFAFFALFHSVRIDRRWLWPLAIGSAVLAAMSAVNARQAIETLRRMMM